MGNSMNKVQEFVKFVEDNGVLRLGEAVFSTYQDSEGVTHEKNADPEALILDIARMVRKPVEEAAEMFLEAIKGTRMVDTDVI